MFLIFTTLSIGLFTILSSSSGVLTHKPSEKRTPLPTIVIPLDKPVPERYEALHKHFSDKDSFKTDLQDVLSSVSSQQTLFRIPMLKLISSIYMNSLQSSDVYDQLMDLSLKTDVSFGDIALFQLIRHLNSGISISALQKHNGDPHPKLLVAALYSSNFKSYFKKYAYIGDFTENGITVYKGFCFYGSTGVIHGQRRNNNALFSIGYSPKCDGDSSLESNIYDRLFYFGAISPGQVIAQALSTASPQEAYSLLALKELDREAFFLIAGNGLESLGPNNSWLGGLVQRGVSKVQQTAAIVGSSSSSKSTEKDKQSTDSHQWFVVQTPSALEEKDALREKIEAAMNTFSPTTISLESLQDILLNETKSNSLFLLSGVNIDEVHGKPSFSVEFLEN